METGRKQALLEGGDRAPQQWQTQRLKGCTCFEEEMAYIAERLGTGEMRGTGQGSLGSGLAVATQMQVLLNKTGTLRRSKLGGRPSSSSGQVNLRRMV